MTTHHDSTDPVLFRNLPALKLDKNPLLLSNSYDKIQLYYKIILSNIGGKKWLDVMNKTVHAQVLIAKDMVNAANALIFIGVMKTLFFV